MYPSIAKRIKASIADSVLIITFTTLILTVYIYIGIESPLIVLLISMLVFFYEPVLVSWKGMTFGHRIFNFRVIDVETAKNITFLKAITRFLIKSFLGIVSLFWAFFTKRQQSLHDIATKSIVISTNISDQPIDINGLPNIPFSSTQDNVIQASILRRVVISLIWSFVLLIVLSVIYGLVMPVECLEDNVRGISYCKLGEDLFGYIIIGTLIICFVLGSKGILFGARSKKKAVI